MGRDDSRATVPEIDLGPWVGAPPEDQTAEGDFRRAVADLTRDVLAAFAAGGARSAEAPDGAGAAGPAGPLSRAHFDVRATTPYLLVRTYRRMGRSLLGGRGSMAGSVGTGLARDLVLLEIARTRPTSMRHIQRRLRIPAATLSDVVKASVRRGWVRRRRHPGDRRICLIEPTPAGLSRADETARRWRAADEELLKALSPLERDLLRRLLRTITPGIP